MVTSSSSDATVVSSLSRGQLIDVLQDVLKNLDQLSFPFVSALAPSAVALRDSLKVQVGDNLLPQLEDGDTPAIVVVGGSTGAGKSTLVNSILGEEVSAAGILRPTTKTPVLVCNPEDQEVLLKHPLSQISRMVTSDVVPAGLALVDASDLDSVHESNRALAARLLEAADLWLFVTTAARYGDATPWYTLELANTRNTKIAVVLNRISGPVLNEIRTDLMERLAQMGLDQAPFFVVGDVGPHEGLLPVEQVAELRNWLQLLAGKHRAEGLLRRTGRAVWASLREQLSRLADAVDEQSQAAHNLDTNCAQLLGSVIHEFNEDVERGTAAQGAVSTSWLALASSGAPLSTLAQGQTLKNGFFGLKRKRRQQALDTLSQECRLALNDRLEATILEGIAKVKFAWGQATLEGAGVDPHTSSATEVISKWYEGIAEPTHVPRGLTAPALKDFLVVAVTGVVRAREAATRLEVQDALELASAQLRTQVEQTLTALSPDGSAVAVAPTAQLAASLRLRASELKPFGLFGAN